MSSDWINIPGSIKPSPVDSLPQYKDISGNMYSISNLIPDSSKAYCTNRTNIPEYNTTLHANWK